MKTASRSRKKRHGGLNVLLFMALIVAIGVVFYKSWVFPKPIEAEEEPFLNHNAMPRQRVEETVDILVNKEHTLPADYVPSDLREVNVEFADYVEGERRTLRDEAAQALEELFKACNEDCGLQLVAVSGYRSYETQKEIYLRRLEESGADHVEKYIARPGASEHQTGLAMDVATRYDTALEERFADTEEAQWLQEHAWEYGFILRYPDGEEDVTGYAYEPWHIRYVGKQNAQEVISCGLVWESYLKQA